jgi:thymidylate synthase
MQSHHNQPQESSLSFNTQYLQLLARLLNHGERVHCRTGHDTITIRDTVIIKVDVAKDFPMVTSKFVPYRLVLSELLWFLRGDTNIAGLHKDDNHIWDHWATEEGELGPVYGAQWINWNGEGINQITDVMNELTNHPDTRRGIVSAWNPVVLPTEGMSPQQNVRFGAQALPPCHWAFKLRSWKESDGSRTLNMKAHMRSCDVPIGLPFNAPSYATLLMMFAQQMNMNVGTLEMVLDDVHIYDKDNHIEMAKTQINTDGVYPTPKLSINKAKDIFSYTMQDFTLSDYVYTKGIKYDAPAV